MTRHWSFYCKLDKPNTIFNKNVIFFLWCYALFISDEAGHLHYKMLQYSIHTFGTPKFKKLLWLETNISSLNTRDTFVLLSVFCFFWIPFCCHHCNIHCSGAEMHYGCDTTSKTWIHQYYTCALTQYLCLCAIVKTRLIKNTAIITNESYFFLQLW